MALAESLLASLTRLPARLLAWLRRHRARHPGPVFREWLRRSRLRKTLGVILWLAGAGFCATSLGFASVFAYLGPEIPSIETYRHYRYETPLRIYTADDALIGEFGRRLIPIALEDVPEHFLNALIDTEDKRFYRHFGIDLISLANDVVGLATSDIRTGASTITMQLAKVVSFGREQVFIRKFKEMLTALQIERELGKDEILALYVNIMSFGKNAYGVQAAAHTYYGKPAAELNIPQLAMLAGILKKPEGGNPINGPEWALKRRNLVLRRMRAQGSIDAGEYQAAVAAPITARVFQRGIDLAAPYPAEWVRRELFERFGEDIYSGFLVHTTLDAKMQAAAQRAVRQSLLEYDQRHGYRGPAGRVDLASLESGVEAASEAGVGFAPQALATALASYPPSGDLEAALVVSVGETEAAVRRKNGELVRIGWQGLRWARPFFGTDSMGPRPKQAGDVVAAGDVVYIRSAADEWRLAQPPNIQGALVALDPRNGGMRAVVGGWDFRAQQFNHALQARRQPGSGFKPFVYSAALANGITPATIFWDLPRVIDDPTLETEYRPRNDGGFEGPMPLRRGLYRSKNAVSIAVLLKVGVDPVLQHVAKFGFIKDTLPRNTQLAIGGGPMMVAPVQMAASYAVFANGGFRVVPHLIDRVRRLDGSLVFASRHPVVCDPCEQDAEGALLAAEENPSLAGAATETGANGASLAAAPQPAATPEAGAEEDASLPAPPAQRVLDARNAFIMRSLLGDVIRRGTGSRAWKALERNDLGGKTGTTDDATDTWFNGFHPHLAATAWAGFSDGRSTGKNEFGSKTPLSIWIEFMREALVDEPVATQLIPDGVVSVKINPATGLVAAPGDADAKFEYFLQEHPPGQAQRTPARRGDNGRVRPEDVF